MDPPDGAEGVEDEDLTDDQMPPLEYNETTHPYTVLSFRVYRNTTQPTYASATRAIIRQLVTSLAMVQEDMLVPQNNAMVPHDANPSEVVFVGHMNPYPYFPLEQLLWEAATSPVHASRRYSTLAASRSPRPIQSITPAGPQEISDIIARALTRIQRRRAYERRMVEVHAYFQENYGGVQVD
jgi:hypothetical protein